MNSSKQARVVLDEHPFMFSTSVVALPLYTVLLMWFVFWLEVKFSIRFTEYGIYPRTFDGLKGVLFSPFIHGDLNHLYQNSIPMLILLASLRYFYRSHTWTVLIVGILGSGFGTWLIGRPSFHIGASGLIYVLIGYILLSGLRTRYYRLVALSLGIVFLYGGLLWYIFPDVQEGMSWEGHLSGLLTGVMLSFFTSNTAYKKPIKYEWERPDFDPMQDPFMKNFDENGNFSPPQPEPLEALEGKNEYWTQQTTSSREFNIIFIPTEKKEETNGQN